MKLKKKSKYKDILKESLNQKTNRKYHKKGKQIKCHKNLLENNNCTRIFTYTCKMDC